LEADELDELLQRMTVPESHGVESRGNPWNPLGFGFFVSAPGWVDVVAFFLDG